MGGTARNGWAPRALPVVQYQIAHPTPADVNSRGVAAVVQNVLAVAPGILKRIGQYRHRAEVAGVVHLPGERHRGVGTPRRGEGNGAERVAEDVAEQVALTPPFLLSDGIISVV